MPQYFGQLHSTEQPWSTIGAVQEIQQDERHIHFKCGNPSVTISVLAPNLIRSEGQETIVGIGAKEGSFSPVARETIVELVGIGEQRFVEDGTTRQLTFSTPTPHS